MRTLKTTGFGKEGRQIDAYKSLFKKQGMRKLQQPVCKSVVLAYLYLYKIESLNLGRRDLGNGKSYLDMQYTGGFSIM